MFSYAECIEGKSSKFWHLVHEAGALHYMVQFGRIGKSGQKKLKEFDSVADCEKAVYKDEREKRLCREQLPAKNSASPAKNSMSPRKNSAKQKTTTVTSDMPEKKKSKKAAPKKKAVAQGRRK